ncbi:DUF3833 domain-containing protein [Dongia rigui]|uniref:DUF3833 domain-containing protein n=1 Tax=Dongia rigui TaxID=940149 RepID=A0ABU5E3H4_9PROT|nr:DUF3833 domain-containing protein [Dongia rigui]MDY0873361.1 DUF3833 domain-containing protein [Dongia rigui]
MVGFKRILGVGLLLAAGIALSGCNTMKIEDFAGKQPVLKPETYFLGETRGSGMFHDRFGNLRRQFVVDMVGEMDGDVLVLTEDFVYDDGEKEQRVWHLKPIGGGRYEGVAGDVIGTANGEAAGNAFQWSYQIDLKVGEGRWRVSFDDWMFLQPGGVILNRATVTRWGIEIGTLTVSFHKKDAKSAFLGTQPQTVAQAAE